MKMTEGEKTRNYYFIAFMIIWVAQMAAAFYFCMQKQGFHEDEYYTYYSTARTAGFYVEDGRWMERDEYRNEFVVLPGQQFQYGLVRQVQSWDVHPPVYYWVFHTVASLVPGVFSKWIGLSINLFFHGINLILLTYLSYLVSGRDIKMACLATLISGFSPAAMSGVVFIRMYEMLTTFVLCCAILHVRAVIRSNEELSGLWDLLPMAMVTYLGFMTQYYYFIFLFFLAIPFSVWLLWRDRKLWNCLRYGLCQCVAFGLAYLTYPAFPAQMFRGQRGAQAAENFFDLSNTLERVWFFLDLMNGYVFGYLFFVILLMVISLAVRVRRRSNSAVEERVKQSGLQFGIAFWILLFAVAGYFLTVSKTALLLGETSNRYQLPIYGMVVFLALFACRTLWRQAVVLVDVKPAIKVDEKPGILYRLCPSAVKVLMFVFELIGDLWGYILTFFIKHKKYTEKLALLFCAVMIVMAYLRVNVVFLYPEDREQTAFAKEQASEQTPVVYLYHTGEEWCIWDVTNELMAYDSVYFAATQGEPILDERLLEADAMVVYLAKEADEEKEFARLFEKNARLEKYRLCFAEKYCDVYYVE